MRILRPVSYAKAFIEAKREARRASADEKGADTILSGHYSPATATDAAVSMAIEKIWSNLSGRVRFYQSLRDLGILSHPSPIVNKTVTRLLAETIKDNAERLNHVGLIDIHDQARFFGIDMHSQEIASALIHVEKSGIQKGDLSSLHELIDIFPAGESLLPHAIVSCISWSNYGTYDPLTTADKLKVQRPAVINAATQLMHQMLAEGNIMGAASVRFSVGLSIPKLDRDAFGQLMGLGRYHDAEKLVKRAVENLQPVPTEDGMFLIWAANLLDNTEIETSHFPAITSAMRQ